MVTLLYYCPNNHFFFFFRFSLIKEHLIEFNQLAMASADGSHDMINRVMTKDNIGLSALLECKEGIWDNGKSANQMSNDIT